MNLKLTFYKLLIDTKEFNINGITADVKDFGYFEVDSQTAPPDETFFMFVSSNPKVDILQKYGITPEEYQDVTKTLETNLQYFGN